VSRRRRKGRLNVGFWEDWDARQLKAKEDRELQCTAEEKALQGFSGLDAGGKDYTGKLWGGPAKQTYVSKCTHKGNVLVFKTKHLCVYGGGSSRGAYLIPNGIVLDLAGGMVENSVITVTGFDCPMLLSRIKTRSVDIHWKDGSIISWSTDAWKGLLSDLETEAQKQKKPLDVLVACIGGHGRTGTALAIMAYWSGVIPSGQDPVRWIRENYCQEAVETQRQEQYVEDSTRPVIQ